MTVFTKIPVGDKLFVVDWDLVVEDSEVDGDAFECADCQLLSISSTLTVVTGNLTPKMYFSNFDTPAWYAWKISLKPGSETSVLIPPDSALPPPTRFVFPRLEGSGAEGSLKVSALFKEI